MPSTTFGPIENLVPEDQDEVILMKLLSELPNHSNYRLTRYAPKVPRTLFRKEQAARYQLYVRILDAPEEYQIMYVASGDYHVIRAYIYGVMNGLKVDDQRNKS